MRILWILIVCLGAGCQRPNTDRPNASEERASSRAASSDNTKPSSATTGDHADAKMEARPVLRSRPSALDDGVFGDLDDRVVLRAPSWLSEHPRRYVTTPHDEYEVVDDRAVAVVAPSGRAVASLGAADLDGDTIPNALDILIGAKKTVLNGAPYGSPYREIAFPGGDVPRGEGVCTDTLVRAVRNAGLDLQKELNDDIAKSPSSYPMVKKANPNIDHRRVKTLLPYFRRQWVELPVALDSDRPWLPGDIVFMNTMGDDRPDHVGIVSDRLGESGAPLIVNNWTDGYQTSEMDIATFVPVTHRFRIPGDIPTTQNALDTLLDDYELTVPADHHQVVLVTVADRESDSGHLRRFERRGGDFEPVGERIEVTIGAAGLGDGLGLHPDGWSGVGRPKREGDRRAPAGMFSFGTAFGDGDKPFDGDWPYRAVSDADVFVDDPDSEHYNSWQVDGDHKDWSSAERLTMYDLGIVVHHNTADTRPGAGSAIFLHTWQGNRASTLGCTAMHREALLSLLRWLQPDKKPLFVQLVDSTR